SRGDTTVQHFLLGFRLDVPPPATQAGRAGRCRQSQGGLARPVPGNGQGRENTRPAQASARRPAHRVCHLDAKQAEEKAVLMAAPPDGTAVAMRVADISHKEEKSKAGTVPVRVIAFSRVILIKDAAAPGDLGALAENMKNEPSPGGPLGLAMEEHVLR